MIKKILLVSATVVACVAILAGPASAQYGEVDFEAVISDVTVVAGESVTISGTCAGTDDDTVDVSIEDGPSLGSIAVSDDRTFSGSVTIPSDLAPGTYTVLAECGGEVLSITITVSAVGTTPPDSTPGSESGPLARTGTEIDGLVKIGGGLLVAGAAAVLVATKRRTVRA